MTQPNAHVVADSVSPTGVRLTTIEAVIWRPMLAELNTHRDFSRGSASMRAIPVRKLIELVETDPAGPAVFRTEQPGMQGGEPLTGDDEDFAHEEWRIAAASAALSARSMSRYAVHKSIVNRLLEPFLWHRVIITATDWNNFYAQRCHPAAQDDIRIVAEAIRDAIHQSEPAPVNYRQWHTPYVSPDEATELGAIRARQVSVARCANVSYTPVGDTRTYSLDREIARYHKLIDADPPHLSPLEHVATPLAGTGKTAVTGNLRGWAQLRHLARKDTAA